MTGGFYVKRHFVIVLALVVVAVVAISSAQDSVDLRGMWQQTSYVKAENQVRYQTDGYMMFTDTHWMHVSYFNRDPRPEDFAEAHHGTYRVTGPDTLDLNVDMELHMDPKSEFQEAPVFYGEAASLTGAKYHWEGKKLVIDLPSTAQIVLEKIE